jgi:hypothetical protein
MSNPYYQIYDGEIFVKSRCIWHENTLMDFFRSLLISQGYAAKDGSNKIFTKGRHTVIVCLVDDFSSCSSDYNISLPYLFNKDTLVITDNCVTVPTQFDVLRLPSSFYGIYAHEPDTKEWEPDRRFGLSVNRLDAKRIQLFLEIALRTWLAKTSFDELDYINFNCWSWDGDNTTPTGLKENFINQYNNLEPQYQKAFSEVFQIYSKQMPLYNHKLTTEEAHLKSWLNIVAETYSSDCNVALSEKMFRALCLPAPWVTWSGKYTVAHLRSLGFDTLNDLIEHKYDSAIELKTAGWGDKLTDFVFECIDTVNKFNQSDFSRLQSRCNEAAIHNRKLLADMQKAWPSDFAAWLPGFLDRLK